MSPLSKAIDSYWKVLVDTYSNWRFSNLEDMSCTRIVWQFWTHFCIAWLDIFQVDISWWVPNRILWLLSVSDSDDSVILFRRFRLLVTRSFWIFTAVFICSTLVLSHYTLLRRHLMDNISSSDRPRLLHLEIPITSFLNWYWITFRLCISSKIISIQWMNGRCIFWQSLDVQMETMKKISETL